MTEDITSLRKEVDRLTKDIGYIRAREKARERIEATKKEIQEFRNEIRLFMLRLMQGYVPFPVIVEGVGHKLDQADLRKLYHAALNQPRHLARRALTIIYYLYGIGIKTIMGFLGISRNTVKRHIRKFQSTGSIPCLMYDIKVLKDRRILN